MNVKFDNYENVPFYFSQRRHSSGSSLLEALDEEETAKLADCLEKILDVVGESMPEVHGNISSFLEEGDLNTRPM
jgi:hypothetical protein